MYVETLVSVKYLWRLLVPDEDRPQLSVHLKEHFPLSTGRQVLSNSQCFDPKGLTFLYHDLGKNKTVTGT